MSDERQSLPSASEMWRNANCHGNRILISSIYNKGLRRAGSDQSSEGDMDARIGQRIHSDLAGEREDLERKEREIRDNCDRLAKLAENQFFGGRATRILYEQRFWYHIGETPFFSGKPDRVYINSERVLDVNFKTGRGDTEDAHLNLQLRAEVVLLKHCYPEVKEIGVSIIQPLVTQTPEIAVYDEAACHKALIEILEIVDATAWDYKRTAGTWCKFCPARAFCPESRTLATEYPLTIQVDDLPSGQAASDVLERIGVAYHLLDALWDAFKAKVEADPDSVPGWWIGKGRKIRSIENFYAAMVEADAEDNPGAIGKIEIGKLEEYCAINWKLKGKSFRDKFDCVFGDLIVTKQTAGSLERIPKRLRDK